MKGTVFAPITGHGCSAFYNTSPTTLPYNTTILNPTQQVYINSPPILLLYNNWTTILQSLLLKKFLGTSTFTFRKLGSVTFNGLDNPCSNHYCN